MVLPTDAVRRLTWAICLLCRDPGDSQEPARLSTGGRCKDAPEIPEGAGSDGARGPIHEAFAMPTTEPKQTPGIPKKPPLPIDEMPPAEKPEGDAIWVGGYWSWDDDRADFLWVSGCWRVKPVGKERVPGYWREVGDVWQWVSGFWTTVTQEKAEPVTYYPAQPAPPPVAPPGDPPAADTFYIPGYWMWSGDHYVWRAGYWTRVRSGYVYVLPHTIAGRRPVTSSFRAIGTCRSTRRGFALYAGGDPIRCSFKRAISLHSLLCRDRCGRIWDTPCNAPSCGFYYFGDYYGPRYAGIGFESGVVYSPRQHDTD